MKPISRRPRLSFSVARGWLNDPNGLVFFAGEYHLFFQYYPYGIEWGPMHWGHAVSTDMVEWKELDIALRPDEKGMIFSGCAVVDEDDDSGFFDGGAGLIAFYTAFRRVAGTDRNEQEQCLAYSRDRGRTWTKYAGNPILKNPGIVDFRDPKVLRSRKTGKWVMVLSGGDRVFFYGSNNLKDWRRLSEFGIGEAGPQDCIWECPDLLHVPEAWPGREERDLWLLKLSVSNGNPMGGSGELLVPGHFDGTAFEALERGRFEWLDYGQDCYASQSWYLPGSDRIVILSWVSNSLYSDKIPTGGFWRGILSLPRELSVERRNGSAVIVQHPVEEIASYAKPPKILFCGPLTARVEARLPNGPLEISFISHNLDSFLLEFESDEGDRLSIGLAATCDGAELTLDRSAVGTHFLPGVKEVQRIALPASAARSLSIWYDQSVWQMFIDGGERVSTNLIFPKGDFSRVRLSPPEPAEGNPGEAHLVVTPYTPTDRATRLAASSP